MLKPTIQKLNNDKYDRPNQTYTDKLTVEEIESKLEDYTKVEDIYKVPLGTHLRYFCDQEGKKVFRTGGVLLKADGLPNYVILSNGTKSWSVQVKDAIFFRKMTLKEIKESYTNRIEELEQEVLKLKNLLVQKGSKIKTNNK